MRDGPAVVPVDHTPEASPRRTRGPFDVRASRWSVVRPVVGRSIRTCGFEREAGKRVRRAVGRGEQGSDPRVLGISRGAGLARRTTGSVNRSQEAAGGAIEGEALILPGCALTESCQSLHESPDRSRIRFEPFREPEGLGSLLLRQLQSRRGRIENLLAV